jgi:citrate synthase/citryl-CoA lyase
LSGETPWKTAISEVAANVIRIRGYGIDELMEKVSFSDVIYLTLKGDLPDDRNSEIFRAILVSSVDHGVTPPSTLAARTVMSAGNPLNAAVAAGILAIGEVHGGAIEQSARIMQEVAAKVGDPQTLAIALVKDFHDRKLRLPGFGHQLHSHDPRAVKLFEMAGRLDLAGRHCSLALAIEESLADTTGKLLPINIDGAIAAVTSDMGFDWRLGKAFFMMSRIAGLAAHACEEESTQKPIRKLGDFNSIYVGPPHRKING